MTQRFFVGTIKPSKWLALTMSFNISKSQKRRDITLKFNPLCLNRHLKPTLFGIHGELADPIKLHLGHSNHHTIFDDVE